MMILSIFLGIAAIGFCCWLLFTLAIFALPTFAGVAIGLWAYHAGAGVAGGIVVGAIAAFLTLVVLQAGLMFARPLWLRAALALAFVVPAAVAGFHATHGIVKHAVPSPTWQLVFSLIGSLAIGITAYIRLTTLAAAQPKDRASCEPNSRAPRRYSEGDVPLSRLGGQRKAGSDCRVTSTTVAPHQVIGTASSVARPV